KEVRRFPASETRCQAAWLPDGKTLVVRRFDDQALHLYDLATGKEIRTIEEGGGSAWSPEVLFVSADGNMLATGVTPSNPEINFSSPTFQLWDTATGNKLRPFTPATSPQWGSVTSAAFSPDGRNLLTATRDDRLIRLWEIATGKQRQQFTGHEADVGCLVLCPDGKTLPSAGADGAVRLWEVMTGKERRRFRGHQGPVTALAWSADGKTLTSGSRDTTVLVWDVLNLHGEPPAAAKLSEQELEALWA